MAGFILNFKSEFLDHMYVPLSCHDDALAVCTFSKMAAWSKRQTRADTIYLICASEDMEIAKTELSSVPPHTAQWENARRVTTSLDREGIRSVYGSVYLLLERRTRIFGCTCETQWKPTLKGLKRGTDSQQKTRILDQKLQKWHRCKIIEKYNLLTFSNFKKFLLLKSCF